MAPQKPVTWKNNTQQGTVFGDRRTLPVDDSGSGEKETRFWVPDRKPGLLDIIRNTPPPGTWMTPDQINAARVKAGYEPNPAEYYKTLGLKDTDAPREPLKPTARPQGAQGAQGAQPSRPQGAQGAQGAQPSRPQGAQGAQGAQPSRPQGAQGAQGAQPPRPQGAQGRQGAQPPRPQGAQGRQGAQPAPAPATTSREDGLKKWASIYGPGGSRELKQPTPSQSKLFANIEAGKPIEKPRTIDQDVADIKSARMRSIERQGGDASKLRTSLSPKQVEKSDAIARELEDTRKRQRDLSSKPGYRREPVPEAYDLVLDYLLSEGHADTVEEAHYVMMQLDSEYIQRIVEN